MSKKPKQEPVAWMYVNLDGECEEIVYGTPPTDDDSITPLYTAPPAAAPEPEPVAYFDPQKQVFYWAKPTRIDAPTTVDVPHLPLYTAPPAAAPSEDIEALRRDAERWRKAQAKYIAWQKGGKAEAMQEDKT